MPSIKELKEAGKIRHGWNKDSPIYKAGYVVGGQSSNNSSPDTKADPMQPAADAVEAFLRSEAEKYSAAPSDPTETESTDQ